MDLLPIEESACYRRLRDPRIVDSEPFTLAMSVSIEGDTGVVSRWVSLPAGTDIEPERGRDGEQQSDDSAKRRIEVARP